MIGLLGSLGMSILGNHSPPDSFEAEIANPAQTLDLAPFRLPLYFVLHLLQLLFLVGTDLLSLGVRLGCRDLWNRRLQGPLYPGRPGQRSHDLEKAHL